jgi:hypothetical protein
VGLNNLFNASITYRGRGQAGGATGQASGVEGMKIFSDKFKLCISIVIFSAGIFLTVDKSFAGTEEGVVVVGERGCKKRDRIIIDTNTGYMVAQVYTGYFYKGDQVIGDLSSYGLFDVLVNGNTGSFYIEDYSLSRSRAAEKCFGG